jgi:hypothetical protein
MNKNKKIQRQLHDPSRFFCLAELLTVDYLYKLGVFIGEKPNFKKNLYYVALPRLESLETRER